MIQIYSDMYLVDTDVPSLTEKATSISNSKPLVLKGNLLIDYINGIAMFDCKDCKLFIDCISITEYEDEMLSLKHMPVMNLQACSILKNE